MFNSILSGKDMTFTVALLECEASQVSFLCQGEHDALHLLTARVGAAELNRQINLSRLHNHLRLRIEFYYEVAAANKDRS